MKMKGIMIASIFIAFVNTVLASEFNLEEIQGFLKDGLITEEEFEVLRDEILGTGDYNSEYLYEITLNNTLRNNSFKAKIKDEKIYFPLLDFFSIISLKNYELKDKELTALLGEELLELKINLKNKKVLVNGEKSSYTDEIFSEDNEIYIQSEFFERLFTKSFEKDDNNFKIKTILKFKTPYELKNQIDNRINRFEEENNKNTIIYTHENSLFDLGYLRTKIDYSYEDRDKNGEWTSSLEYQGGLLYGELTTSYDVKKGQFGDVRVYYPEIYKGHSLEVGSYGIENRELGLLFKKEKGYFTIGDEIVIRENVPLGSRVELLYLGFPIDVRDSENGIIEFSGPEIRRDRDYSLRVYSPDGTISIIDISTNKSYNQQTKGEIEYDVDIREDSRSGSYRGNANVYYGITDNLTLGLGINKFYEEDREENYKKITAFNPELVYGNSIKKNDYTIVFGSEYVSSNRKIDYLETEVDIKKIKLRSKLESYDKYYEEKFKQRYTIEYNASAFQIIYNYADYKYRENIDSNQNKEREINYDIGVNYNVPFKNLLVTTDYRIDKESRQEYSISGYYTGYYLFNIKLTNRWRDNGKDYVTTLSFNNKDLSSNIDYSLVFDYTNRGDKSIGIKFQLDLDNWFNFGVAAPNSSRTTYTVGIDRIVDLKNIKENIRTMDSSRIKTTTFLDENNNGVYDENEEVLPYNEIRIGQKDTFTDENGEAWVYGVPNNILYDLDLKIQKPSYTIGENKLKVQGKRVGTISAYIPIKTKVNLIGQIDLSGIKLTELNKIRLMQELSVRIKDSEGNLIEKLVVEDDGMFFLSEIYPGDYQVEILYWGEEYSIDKIEKNIEIKYLDGKDDLIKIDLNVNKEVKNEK